MTTPGSRPVLTLSAERSLPAFGPARPPDKAPAHDEMQRYPLGDGLIVMLGGVPIIRSVAERSVREFSGGWTYLESLHERTGMDITTQPLIDEHLDDAMQFLRLANPFVQHTWGWEIGRLVDWRWGGNILRDRTEPGFFGRNGTVVRRKNGIAALVIAESGADDHCILTATDDADLFGIVLAWLLEQRDGQSTIFYPSDEATWIHDVLVAHGFRKGDVEEVAWGYDLTQLGELPPAPGLFIIDHVSSESDYPEIARCLKGAFGGDGDRIAVLRSLAGNPQYRPELNVVARSADGRIASYCRGTVDADSGLGSIDPVATHPDFQGSGLGRAIVLACFAAQAPGLSRELHRFRSGRLGREPSVSQTQPGVEDQPLRVVAARRLRYKSGAFRSN